VCGSYVLFILVLINPTAAPYEILVHDGIVHDIDPQDWDRWWVCSLNMLPADDNETQVRVYFVQGALPDCVCPHLARHRYRYRATDWTVCRSPTWLPACEPDTRRPNAKGMERGSSGGSCVAWVLSPGCWVLLTAWQWFPMEYYGNEDEGGMNGHFYHVFNTVRLQHITGTSRILILW